MAKTLNRKLKMGMVGGGPGAFIGDVHRKAAQLDGGVELVAGAFSSDAKKSKAAGEKLFLKSDRVYTSYAEMIKKESALPEGERIDFVSIVTPNKMHFPVARDFFKAGFNVVCDKPMTFTLAEAKELQKLVHSRKKQVFALTHNYTGYPMVKLARDLIAKKTMGKVLKIMVQYPQGWLLEAVNSGSTLSLWRCDPKVAGKSCCMGDIGTHAENLAEYITGLQITDLCADLGSTLPGNPLDDDGAVLCRYTGGVRGVLCASQISIGELNGIRIQVFCQKGSLAWKQEDPNELYVYSGDGTLTLYRRGTPAVGALSPAAAAASRLPFGHPEAFYEAFANVYKNATDTMRALLEGRKPSAINLDFPTVDDGVRGMQFIESVVASSKKRAWIKWMK